MKLFYPQYDYLVKDVIIETPLITHFKFRPAGEPRLTWQPGQYLSLSFRRHNRWSQERTFSFISTPKKDGTVEISCKQFGPYTKTLAQLKPGDVVRLSGPYGTFGRERKSGRRILFLAGGIGITPLLGMLRGFADEHSKAELTLVFANKAEDGIPLTKELAEVAQALPNFKLVNVAGTVTPELLREAAGDIKNLDLVYLCGPGGYMAEMTRQLKANGLPANRLKTEAFTVGPGRLRGAQFWTAAGVYLGIALLFVLIMNLLQPTANLLSWYQARAAGLTSGLLITFMAISGISVATGLAFRVIPPLYAWTLHKATGISLAAMVGIHILGIWRTPIYDLNLWSILLPIGPLRYALGTVAMYGVLVLVLTSLSILPKHHRVWKVLHFLSYLSVLLVFIHAWLVGTDLLNPAVRAVWGVLLAIILALIGWRISHVGAVRNGLLRHKFPN